ncbi:MAG: chemotaxis protein CheW [Proteobacteria bacterium]|nr:chemotaxis protein CheW [Pseudomonadota bacterium]
MSAKALFFSFSAGGRQYAVPLDKVKRVVPLELIHEAPLLKEFYDGVFKYEGEIVALLNLAALHGRPEAGDAVEPLVLLHRIDKQLVGLIIDRADKIVEFDTSSLISIDSGLEGIEKKAVIGDSDFLFFDLDSLTFTESDNNNK